MAAAEVSLTDAERKRIGWRDAECGCCAIVDPIGLQEVIAARVQAERSSKCSIDGCEKKVYGRGWCTMHWKRWKNNGDPEVVTRSWGHGVTSETVKYAGMHRRVRRLRGKASDYSCRDCGGRAHHWAYDHSDPEELSEVILTGRGSLVEVPFSLDPGRYQPMCRRCHRNFDLSYLASA